MIPLCGIAIAFAIIVYFVWEQHQTPTQNDKDKLTNKLNRMALDRNNRKDNE